MEVGMVRRWVVLHVHMGSVRFKGHHRLSQTGRLDCPCSRVSSSERTEEEV